MTRFLPHLRTNLGLYAAFFLFFSMPFYRKIYFFGSFHISPSIIALILFLVWAVLNLRQNIRFRIDSVFFLWAVFLVSILLSTLRSAAPKYHLGIFLSLASSGLLFYFITFSVRTVESATKVLYATVIGATVSGLLGTLFVVLALLGKSSFGVTEYPYGILVNLASTGFSMRRLGYGFNLIPGAVIAFCWAIWGGGGARMRRLFLFALIPILSAIFFSMSRGAWVSFGVASYLSLLFLLSRKRGRLPRIVLSGNLVLILALIPLWVKVFHLLIGINKESVFVRFTLWSSALGYLPKSLLIGQGFGTFRALEGVNVHNILLDVFMGGGLLAFLSMIILILIQLSFLLKVSKSEGNLNILGVSVLFAFLGLFIGSQFLGALTSRYIWSFLGLANALRMMSTGYEKG